MTDFYAGKKVLVTGGTGLVGIPLVQMLVRRGAEVHVASLDGSSLCPGGASFHQLDLTEPTNCRHAVWEKDVVFHLAGVKSSPRQAVAFPAASFDTMVLCNTNMLRAAYELGVDWYLYTSSVGAYGSHTRPVREDALWTSDPSANDWYPGWAKRIGEMQLGAYRRQYGWERHSIVRLANVYGPHDRFDGNGMAFASLVKRAVDGEDPLVVWGDGSAVRDFVHARDAARAMLFAVENGINVPLNVGGDRTVTIKELVELIVGCLPKKPAVVWDTSKPTGDPYRCLDVSRLCSYGFGHDVSLEDGVRETVEWYAANRGAALPVRFDPFNTGE